jgi:hypothetical protein
MHPNIKNTLLAIAQGLFIAAVIISLIVSSMHLLGV